MISPRIRVWVEEVQPPGVLLFTWRLPDDFEEGEERAFQIVLRTLEEADGVLHADPHEEGILVEIDPDDTSRYQLATAIRTALAPDDPEVALDPTRIRVWAEDLSGTKMRLTWVQPEHSGDLAEPQDRRAVAARLSVVAGIRSVSPDQEGVLITYEPTIFERGDLANTVRAALNDWTPLRGRADALLKRAPIYGNLARKLAMDDRVSPLPDAAKQAVASRATGGPAGNVAARTALRFVPGAAWITRIQTLVPMLTELSKWSRESDPEIVDEHLTAVGLDRATLRADTVTAHEIKMFARDSAFETGAELGGKASAGARQAISAGKGFIDSFRDAMRSDEESQDKSAVDSARDEAQSSSDPDESGPPATDRI